MTHTYYKNSNKLASYSDELLLSVHEDRVSFSKSKPKEYRGDLKKISKWAGKSMLAHLVGTVAFPVVLSVDLCANAGASFKECCIISFSNDKEFRNEHRKLAKEHIKAAGNCALGILASPAAIVKPDIVSHLFIPPQSGPERGVIDAGGKLYSSAGYEHFPNTLAEVQELVCRAKAENCKVSIAGAHFSQSKDTLPNGTGAVCINMSAMKAVTIHPERKTATVEGGATWKDIQDAADQYGLAVKVMQASNVFSVGGSIGVNCHGWDHRTGTLGETVRWMKIIDHQGLLKQITPSDPEFAAIVGGHGLCGVIVEVELGLADNEKLISRGHAIEPEDYVRYFKEEILPNEDHVMHLYRLGLNPKNLLRDGVAVTYSRSSEGQECGVSSNLVEEPPQGELKDRIFMQVGRSFGFARGLYWKQEKKRILQEASAFRNEIMRPPIHAAFSPAHADAEWLQEYFISGEELASFLTRLGEILTEEEVRLLNATVRYVKQDDLSALPYAKGEDRFAIVLFFNQSLAPKDVEKTKLWVQKVIDELHARGGTYYLPYQHFATREQFAASYPDAENFVSLKRCYDPEERFDNGFYRDYFKAVQR